MTHRVYNFGAGPCTLPLSALQEAQEEFLNFAGSGMSILELSHRTATYEAVYNLAQDNIRKLLNVPDNYKILFMQGGATLQFSMLSMNYLQGGTADYVVAGTWGKKAIAEAKREGEPRVVFNGADENFKSMPEQDEIEFNPDAAYFHHTSNETIQGVERRTPYDTGSVPQICDMSSDFMAYPVDVSQYAMIYAGAQKNAAPAGLTIAIISDEQLAKGPDNMHAYLDYNIHASKASAYNTPPVFPIYMLSKVTSWMLNDVGDLQAMYERNNAKADMLYNVIDNSGGFYKGHAAEKNRSIMNVTWTLDTPELEQKFLSEATAADLIALKGHRSVGGLRASIYNAMTPEGCKSLSEFMREFQRVNG